MQKIRGNPEHPDFESRGFRFAIEPYEYLQGYSISIYTDLDKMLDLAEAVDQNKFCDFPIEAYSIAVKYFKFLKDPMDKYKVNLKCLLKLIYLLQEDYLSGYNS
jgi:hypothetical protein